MNCVMLLSAGVAVLSVALSGCEGAVKVRGEIVLDAYHNKYVGLRFPLPKGWHVGTDAAVEQLTKEGAKVMGLGGPGARRVVSRTPGHVLLMVSERPLDSDVETLNRNLLLAAIDVRGHRDEVGSGADYIRLVRDGLRNAQPTATISDAATQRLAEEEFHTFDASYSLQGVDVCQRQMACIANDYLVIIAISAGTSDGLDELMQLAKSLSLSPVSEAVDGSVEGKAFRKQAGMK